MWRRSPPVRSIENSTGPLLRSSTPAPVTPDTQQEFSTRVVTWFLSQHIAPGAAVRG